MCYSIQRCGAGTLVNTTISPSFKRRCVSLSSMADLPTCPIVSGVSHFNGLPTQWKDDILSDTANFCASEVLDDSVDAPKHVCPICIKFLRDTWVNPIPAESSSIKSFQLYSLYRVLRRSTQPAHVIIMLVVASLAAILVPAKSSLSTGQVSVLDQVVWPLVYLGSFSILFGAQMWMTFVSGLVLLFLLPRHTFARVQSALFPKYMVLNAAAALATLMAFAELQKHSSIWSNQETYQIAGLVFCCLGPLLARIYVVPGLLRQIAAKVALERVAGHGAEAGPKLDAETTGALATCDVYKSVCRSFRRLHMTVAIVNMMVLGCNIFHLYYLASKVCFI